jgi:hypothetical protein
MPRLGSCSIYKVRVERQAVLSIRNFDACIRERDLSSTLLIVTKPLGMHSAVQIANPLFSVWIDCEYTRERYLRPNQADVPQSGRHCRTKVIATPFVSIL